MVNKEIKALMIEPGKHPVVTVLNDDLDSLQKAVSIGADYQGLILDVSYNLENGYGQRFYILQSYPLNSAPLKRFYTAMVNFGLDSGTGIDRVVGVTEKIFLEYPPGGSKIGSITKRVPYDPPEEDVADDE